MIRRSGFLILFVVLLATLIGCVKAVPIAEYKPKTEDEAAVHSLIMARETAHRNGDKAFFERKSLNDGEFMCWDGTKHALVSKSEWLEFWPKFDKDCRDIKYKNLEIQFTDPTTARADLVAYTPRWTIKDTQWLKKIDGAWFFQKTSYKVI